MWNPTEASAPAEQATGLLGDIRELAGQLDLPPSPVGPRSAGVPDRVITPEILRSRLDQYVQETLVPREWPAIVEAHWLTVEGRFRDLVMLDQRWSVAALQQPLAEASFRAGRRQLNKLQGLRHERVLQRYREAVDAGEAWGWHPIVFGVVLGVYQLPLRQGLMQFATHCLAGLASAAERLRQLPAAECQRSLDAAVGALPRPLGGVFLGGPRPLA
jgi:urease accessory protein UreF